MKLGELLSWWSPCLASVHEAMGSITPHKLRFRGHPGIGRWRQEQRRQGHSQLHSEFKASLGYKNLRRTEDRDELSFFMSVVETG